MAKRKSKRSKPSVDLSGLSVELTDEQLKALGDLPTTGSIQIGGTIEDKKFIPAKPTMRMDIRMEEVHWFFDPDLDEFVAELKSAGIPLELGDIRTKSPVPGYGFAGPFSDIVIKIDPDNLRLIFEYALSLITVYKANDYFGAFFKKAIETLGEKAGSKIATILSRLWLNLNARIRAMTTKQLPPPMNLHFESLVEGVPVYITMEIRPSRANEVSKEDEEQAAGLLFCKVIPALPKVIRQARASEESMEAVYATLVMPESTLDNSVDVEWRRGSWHWHVFIIPLKREFIIDSRGRRKNHPATKSKGE